MAYLVPGLLISLMAMQTIQHDGKFTIPLCFIFLNILNGFHPKVTKTGLSGTLQLLKQL